MADINPKLIGGEQRTASEEPGQAMVQSEIVLNDRDAHTAYSNFARVTATPEEVIIDFALNPNPFVQGKHEVKITQRLVLNFFTAKRLSRALVATLQRIEASFGNIELDVHRRVQGAQTPGSPVNK
ncbi:MAG TPA: DUF3467 domain-containing protein [Gemmataceae bacterium]|nr:DUF3467 domain-containing protein [Gemmataceae bacterium]